MKIDGNAHFVSVSVSCANSVDFYGLVFKKLTLLDTKSDIVEVLTFLNFSDDVQLLGFLESI